ncbi:hypothetical protein MAP00_008724 [Monascus purpureus]|nr:hypothetical protein MAP00_008724 [Monascus purpureus]
MAVVGINGHVDIVKLLQKGVDPNPNTRPPSWVSNCESPFDQAASHGQEAVARLLVPYIKTADYLLWTFMCSEYEEEPDYDDVS